MEKGYAQYWNVGLTIGLTLVIFSTLLLLYVLIDKNKSDSDNLVVSTFYKSFLEGNLGIIILKFFTLIILNFFQICFTLLTQFYFAPIFILIGHEFTKFIYVLIENPEKAYVVVFFILQFFCLMIVLEIIELGFCGLNKNTKRNIIKRGYIDFLGEDGRDSNIIDINKDYYLDNNGKNEKKRGNRIKRKFI